MFRTSKLEGFKGTEQVIRLIWAKNRGNLMGQVHKTANSAKSSTSLDRRVRMFNEGCLSFTIVSTLLLNKLAHGVAYKMSGL